MMVGSCVEKMMRSGAGSLCQTTEAQAQVQVLSGRRHSTHKEAKGIQARQYGQVGGRSEPDLEVEEAPVDLGPLELLPVLVRSTEMEGHDNVSVDEGRQRQVRNRSQLALSLGLRRLA